MSCVFGKCYKFYHLAIYLWDEFEILFTNYFLRSQLIISNSVCDCIGNNYLMTCRDQASNESYKVLNVFLMNAINNKLLNNISSGNMEDWSIQIDDSIDNVFC